MGRKEGRAAQRSMLRAPPFDSLAPSLARRSLAQHPLARSLARLGW
jgi:hypothetical protein